MNIYTDTISKDSIRVRSIFSSARVLVLVGVIASLLINSSEVFAQSANANNKAGTTSGQFLKIGVGSRYLGMGEAAVAAKGDAFSIFWNPAALTEIEGSELAFAHTNWALDVSLSSVAYAWRWEGLGAVAFGLTALNVPELEITTVESNESQQGTGRYYDAPAYAIQAAFARELTPRFAFGAGVKYVYESIHTETASTIAFDFGTMLYTGLRSLRMGMSISNLGGDLRFAGPSLAAQVDDSTFRDGDDASLDVNSADLPLTFRFGMAYDLDFSLDSRLTLATEMKHPSDQVRQSSFGLEYGWKNQFFLRSGYKFNYSEEGLTFGAGLKAPFGTSSRLLIDYAWSDLGRLQSAHRFSLNLAF
ncbi:PorV/PorQ family protein [Gemmatimonas aurantiaca]|nr:PorV/PorQ family protein [Gemmatimonas aurantiaca]